MLGRIITEAFGPLQRCLVPGLRWRVLSAGGAVAPYGRHPRTCIVSTCINETVHGTLNAELNLHVELCTVVHVG